MALSLDDLKKKRPIRANLPNKTESNSENIPIRKRLMPWDPIPTDEKHTSDETINENQDFNSQSLDISSTTDKNILQQMSTASLTIEAEPTSLFCEAKTKNEDPPLIIECTTTYKRDLPSHIQSSEPFTLNTPESPVLNDNFNQYSGTIFSKNDLSDSSPFHSDTDVTQISHRSDTDTIQNSANDLKQDQLLKLNSTVTKSHRSDTNEESEVTLENFRSVTEVTQNNYSTINKAGYTVTSDTEVTRLSSKTPSLNYRNDTNLTQTMDVACEDLDQFKQTVVSPITSSRKNRSDTEVAHIKKSKAFVSHLHEDVTQKELRSDTEVTPISTQKRHKEVTQSTAFSESDLILRRILILRGNGLNVFNYCCSILLQIGQNILQTSYEAIALHTSVNIGSIKTTLKRLRDDNLLNIESHGGGKGAVIDLIIEDAILKVFARNLKNRSDTEMSRIVIEKQHRCDTNQDTIPSSMYRIVNKNTIHTGTENQNPQEPDSWAELREVDFSALERWNIRNTVIESIKKNKWVVSKEQLEDHIERFARYFTEPEFEARRSKILSPLAFFLGSIKLIARGEPDPIQDVKTQMELAQEIAMKNRFAEMENRKRQFETFERQLDQYRESEFEHWLSSLNREQQEQLVSPNKMAQFGSVSYRLLLKSYYTETIWPEFKQTILNGPRA